MTDSQNPLTPHLYAKKHLDPDWELYSAAPRPSGPPAVAVTSMLYPGLLSGDNPRIAAVPRLSK